MKNYVIILAALLCSACASSSVTYAPNGKQAHNLNCSGTARNWGMCYQKAGEICKEAGYDVLHKSNETGAMVQGKSKGSIMGTPTMISGTSSSNIFATTTRKRTMTIMCKTIEAGQ